MGKYILILSFNLILFHTMTAQEILPTYSDYLTDNLYLLHPSMAGASNKNKIRLTARQQWFGIEDAPSLQTISVHGRFSEKLGVGGIFFNDSNGNYASKGIYGSLAYHLRFSRVGLELNQLSFGISGIVIQRSLDQSSFTEFDPILRGSSADIYANMDVGFSYHYFNLFAHLTAKNILPLSRDLYYTLNLQDNQRSYIFSTGYVMETRRNQWKYEPSILFLYKEAIKEKTLDINMKAYRAIEPGNVFGGLSYRRGFDGIEYRKNSFQNLQYLTALAGIEFKSLLFAYTYSQQLNSVKLSKGGFHQLTLGYNFGEDKDRYNCYCPGVNQNSW